MKPRDILEQREQRAEYQGRLLELHQVPLVVMRVNTPGLRKNGAVSQEIFEIMQNFLLDKWKSNLRFESVLHSAEGPTLFMVIDAQAEMLKREAIAVEEQHPLGRCIDLDVHRQSGALGRGQLGYGPRKCFLCDEVAHCCARSGKHSLGELHAFMEECLRQAHGHGYDYHRESSMPKERLIE